MPFVEVKNVRKVFSPPGVREPLVAIDQASFQFEAGELVSLLGPSGCGKTTVLRIIAGLVPKTSGSVRIADEEVVGPRASVGFVFQSPNLMPWRTVLDNVLFPAEILRRRRMPRPSRVRATCSTWSGSRISRRRGRTNCPAECSNASRCAVRSCTSRRCC